MRWRVGAACLCSDVPLVWGLRGGGQPRREGWTLEATASEGTWGLNTVHYAKSHILSRQPGL